MSNQPVEVRNLFSTIDGECPDELFETLVQMPGAKLERIVSTGQATPPGEWYDQAGAEWVVLLAGAARLRFDSPHAEHELKPGDYLLIPAHCRHRVEWTSPDEPTVWLALHFPPSDET
jgi:cupin 2 domain-containing protein